MSHSNRLTMCRAEFNCQAPNAASVMLFGAFGDDGGDRLIPMNSIADGEWTAVLELRPGQYNYQFIVLYQSHLNIRDDGPHGALSHIAAAPFSPGSLACSGFSA